MSDPFILSFSRTIPATPEVVWRCWTDTELLKQWFAPAPVVVSEAEMDVRPGGQFRTVMQVPDHGEMAGAPGCVLVADVAQRLVWTNALGPEFRPNEMGSGPMDFGFTADIRMAPDPQGCAYTVTVLHATEEGAKTHESIGFFDGWGAAADQMAALAKTL